MKKIITCPKCKTVLQKKHFKLINGEQIYEFVRFHSYKCVNPLCEWG